MAAPQTLAVSRVRIDLCDERGARERISGRYGAGLPPLGVASINLDHLHHSGRRGLWRDALGASPGGRGIGIEWCNLLDGHPVVARAEALTGRRWPRLAGSDLIGPLLDDAERLGVAVGFLGGADETRELLLETLARERPGLRVVGAWSPPRSVLSDAAASRALAAAIRDRGVQLLVVGLGKPRQELWIETHGAETGAEVLLAFGAVVDFLAHRVRRAPQWVARAGLEWAWRLLLEPRRLAKRYLLQGPGAYRELRGARALSATEATEVTHGVVPAHGVATADPAPTRGTGPGRFVTGDAPAEVAVVVVTYNSADDLPGLIASLRAEARTTALRVVFADNDSTDGTRDLLAREEDATVVLTGGNLGYAGGINAALSALPSPAGNGATGEGPTGKRPAEHVLILNPDLAVEPGCVRALLDRLETSGAGVVVPRIRDFDGRVFRSIRREPGARRAFGDALFGSRFPSRAAWLSDEVAIGEGYDYAHPIDWGSGAAMLIDGRAARRIGPWDERYFLYSEETDFQRRARDRGFSVWFEPAAEVRHRQGASGASRELNALMAVSRIRYFEKFNGPLRATAFRCAVVLGAALRSTEPEHRFALTRLVDRSSWRDLPRATRTASRRARGTIIIPAHNEQAVIARSLASVSGLASDLVEVIVVCNGCDDATAEIARGFAGVEVLELAEASKIAALNAGDAAATHAARLYLDADVEISPEAITAVLDRLNARTADGGFVCDAARPEARYDTAGAAWPVRAYYRARDRMPELHRSLWGAGAYGIGPSGRQRFEVFPDVLADDLFADEQIADDRKEIVPCTPVVVRTPRDS